MDETAIAFELPHARAAATDGGRLLDRISVRDYTRHVEIGAFRAERGVTQRIRFNVVLEVAPHGAAEDDDVDKVVSYDTITEAIEAEIAAERINLLETLAERVATRVLADPRAARVFVRLEKLDRIPGALGVEIVRSRPPEGARLRPVPAAAREGRRPPVVLLAPAPARDAGWREALATLGGPLVVCVAPAAPQPRPATEAQRRIGLLALEQAAWGFADADPRFAVAGSRTELDWALKGGRMVVWAPTHMAMAALDPGVPDASDPVGLAAWLAGEIGAGPVAVAGAPAPAPAVRVAEPADIVALKREELR
jgi:dihydroneopterin aldolase